MIAPVVSRLGEQLLQLPVSADSLRLQDAVLDQTCLMLDFDNGGSNLELARQPLTEVMFERLSAYLERHLRDSELTAERVAQAHRISVRYLHKCVISSRELVAQDRGDVLALAQQPDHIQVVSAFEVAPQQRKLCHPPGPEPRNAQ